MHVHHAHGLNFVVEPSMLSRYQTDVVFWDAEGSIQHTYVAGCPVAGEQAVLFALSLAHSCSSVILQSLRQRRARAIEIDELNGIEL